MNEGERIVAISPVMAVRLSPLLKAIGVELAAGIEVTEKSLRTMLLAAGHDLSPEALHEVLPELLHWSDLLRALKWQPSAPLRDATLEALTRRSLPPATVNQVLDLLTAMPAVSAGTDQTHAVGEAPRSPKPPLTERPRVLGQRPASHKNVGGVRPSLDKKVIRARPPFRPNVGSARPHRPFSSEPAFLQYGLPLVVLFGLVLRVWLATTQSAWNDEAWSLQKMAQIPLGDLYDAVKSYDSHPPFYYAVLHLWVGLTGFGVFQARLLSVVLGTATIPVLYFLAELLFDTTTALAAAFLLAISPVETWYSDEIRMYAASGLFALLTVYLLLRAIREPHALVWAGYIVSAALAVSFDSSGVYLPVAVNLFYVILLVQRKALLWPWLVSNLLALFLALPTLLLLRFQISHQDSAILAWIPTPTISSVWSAARDLLSLNGDSFWVGLIFAALSALGLVGFTYDWRERLLDQSYLLLAFLIVTPFAVALLASIAQPVFIMRTVQTTVYGLLILFARGLVLFLRTRAPIGAIALVAVIGLNTTSLYAAAATTLKEDWRDLVHYAGRHASADSLIVLDPDWLDDRFNLYWQSYHRQTALHEHPAITSELFAAEVFRGFKSVWLVTDNTYDNPPVDAGTAYLQTHYRRTAAVRFFAVTLYHYVAVGPANWVSSMALPNNVHVVPDHVSNGSSTLAGIDTLSGATCVLKIVYDTDRGAPGWSGGAQPADDQGKVAWLVQVETRAPAGTVIASCTLAGRTTIGKARLFVMH